MRRKDKREVKGTEWGWLARVERGWHVDRNMDSLLHPTWERKSTEKTGTRIILQRHSSVV